MEEKYSNPAPLGLMGFGMTTVLLNLHNADILKATGLGMIFAMGIFYGGLAQVIAGIMEYRKGNTFGTTAFTSYGLFWLSLVFLFLAPGWKWVASPVDGNSIGAYMLMWGIFTAFMFIGTLKKNRGLQVVFFTLAVLFFLLAIHFFSAGDTTWVKIAGYEGIFCGSSAIYVAMAEVLNDSYGKTVLPLG